MICSTLRDITKSNFTVDARFNAYTRKYLIIYLIIYLVTRVNIQYVHFQSAQREKRRHLDQGEEVDENYIMQSAQPLPLENKLFEECYVVSCHFFS